MKGFIRGHIKNIFVILYGASCSGDVFGLWVFLKEAASEKRATPNTAFTFVQETTILEHRSDNCTILTFVTSKDGDQLNVDRYRGVY
jgi:hypothetical protein